MSEQNQEKKPKKGFFMFGKKPENYDWDIKKERERDRRIIDSFNIAGNNSRNSCDTYKCHKGGNINNFFISFICYNN